MRLMPDSHNRVWEFSVTSWVTLDAISARRRSNEPSSDQDEVEERDDSGRGRRGYQDIVGADVRA
jgi:hypothetical protein